MTKKTSYQELKERIKYLENIVNKYNESNIHFLHNFDLGLNENVDHEPPYGDVTDLNTCRLILDSVRGQDTSDTGPVQPGRQCKQIYSKGPGLFRGP